MRRLVKINERGRRIGESHPRAVLTDHEVNELLMPLLEQRAAVIAACDGLPKPTIDAALTVLGLSYRLLAEKFEVSKGHIAKIARGARRSQVASTIRECP